MSEEGRSQFKHDGEGRHGHICTGYGCKCDHENYPIHHDYSGSSWALWQIILLIIALAIVCLWIYGIYTFITLVATYCS